MCSEKRKKKNFHQTREYPHPEPFVPCQRIKTPSSKDQNSLFPSPKSAVIVDQDPPKKTFIIQSDQENPTVPESFQSTANLKRPVTF